MRNKKAIYLLFSANAISGIAQGMSLAAVPIYFLTIIKQQSLWTTSLAIVLLLGLFWRLYAGALVDGFKRKDVFLGTSFFAGLIVFAVAGLGYAISVNPESGYLYKDAAEYAQLKSQYLKEHGTLLGFDYNKLGKGLKIVGKDGVAEYLGAQLPTVLPILVFATTLFVYFIHFPNLFAFVQEIESKENYSKLTRWIEIIGQATAMSSGFLTAELMSGKLFGVVTFKPWEIHEIFLLNGITYVISFVIILFIKYQPNEEIVEQKKIAASKDPVTVGESLKIGYEYLKRNKLVFYFGLLSSAIFIAYMTMLWAPLGAYISNNLIVDNAQRAYGFAEAFLAIGALGCALVVKYLFDDMSIPKVIIIQTILITICFFGISLNSNALVFYLICVVIGFTNAGSRIYRVLYLFGEVPNKLIGRVQSILNIPQTLIPVVMLFVFSNKYFSTGHNISIAFMILGSFTLLCTVLIFFIYKKLHTETD